MSTPVPGLADDATGRTQAERTALSDRAMIEAAVELILERGTAKTTLAAIGERAGYSRGLATYRFGSKSGLYDEICRQISRRWINYLTAEVGEKTGIDAMCAAADAYFRFVTESPEDARVLQILYHDAASPDSDFRQTAIDVYQRQRDDVEEWVRQGIRAGSIRSDADPESEAVRFVAFIAGISYMWMLTPGRVNFAKVHAGYKEEIRLKLRP